MKFIGTHIFDYDATFRGDVTIEGNLTISNSVSQTISFGDNDSLYFGNSNDLQIIHDSANSKIENSTGQLTILNTADDKDIVFKTDDGSGGVTDYIRIDGGENYVKFSKDAVFIDDEKVKFGTGLDLEIYHDGSNSYINQRNTGDLIIQASSDDKDIILKSDDGSGGVTAYLTLDGSAGYTTVQKNMRFANSVEVELGTNGNLTLEHNGTNGFITEATGDLTIKNTADDKDIIFQSDDGSGGLATYMTVDGSHTRTKFDKKILVADGEYVGVGDGGDLQIMHNGTNTLVDNITGDLSIRQFTDDGDIIFVCDDGSGGTTAYLTLDGGSGYTKATKDIRFDDNISARFGTGSDLTIKHDGTDSTINNAVGDLIIKNSTDDKDIKFECDDGSGGTTTYFKLDGSATKTVFSKPIEITSSSVTDFVKLISGGSSANPIKLIFEKDVGQEGIIEYNRNGDLEIYNTDGDGGVMISGSASADPDFYISHAGASTFKSTLTVGVDGASHDVKFFGDTSGKYMLWDASANQLRVEGGIRIDSSSGNALFKCDTGNLKIQVNEADHDLLLQCDDGSGSIVTYLKLDGQTVKMNAAKNIEFQDNVKAEFGEGDDLEIYHDGTSSFINNDTGHLYIDNNADDKDIVLRCDDDSGGLEEYIKLDGSQHKIHISVPMIFGDTKKILFGDGNDFQILHDGTDSHITNKTSHLTIENEADDGDIIFRSDDGSGGVATYLTLDGGLGFTQAQKKIRFIDNVPAEFGSQGDFTINHNGSHLTMNNSVGNITIRNYTDDGDIIFESDDGSGGVEEYFRLDGGANTDGNPRTKFPDNSRLMFGAGDDMDIFHNGTNSFIRNNSTSGDLIIQQSGADKDVILKCDDGSGGETAYITLDGSAGHTTVQKEMQFENNVPIRLGTSNASQMSHSGSDFYFANAIGDVDFYNHQDDGDISFFTDNGSGGSTEYLRLDGGDLSVNILTQKLVIANLPTSDPGVDGQVWNNSGVLNISSG